MTSLQLLLLSSCVVFSSTSARAPIDDRVPALLAKMNTTEKLAQLIYGGAPSSIDELMRTFPFGTGSILSGPTEGAFAPWRNAVQAAFMNASRLRIPVSFYEETLRSAGVYGSTVFPPGVGLGATWTAR